MGADQTTSSLPLALSDVVSESRVLAIKSGNYDRSLVRAFTWPDWYSTSTYLLQSLSA